MHCTREKFLNTNKNYGGSLTSNKRLGKHDKETIIQTLENLSTTQHITDKLKKKHPRIACQMTIMNNFIQM